MCKIALSGRLSRHYNASGVVRGRGGGGGGRRFSRGGRRIRNEREGVVVFFLVAVVVALEINGKAWWSP